MDGIARIALSVDADSDALSGTLEFDGGRQRFNGWLELMALVEDLRRDAAQATRDVERDHEGRSR